MATKEQIRSECDAHEAAGVEFVRDYRAELGLKKSNGTMTLIECSNRQIELKVELDLIKFGDWKTAKEELEHHVPNAYCPKDELESLIALVNTYISNNYSLI